MPAVAEPHARDTRRPAPKPKAQRTVILSGGQECVVDEEDFPNVVQWKWRLNHSGYAVRSVGRNSVFMHREILAVASDLRIDHKNGIRLDNRRCNLRIASQSQNNANMGKPKSFRKGPTSSIYKGVCWRKRCSRWRATIKYQKKAIELGLFKSEVDAAKAYDVAALVYFGEFARINFPSEAQ